jgi:putative transposase
LVFGGVRGWLIRLYAELRDIPRRILCSKGRKVNLSHAFAGQNVSVTQVGDRIWLVTFMHYDLGYFDDETCRLEPIENPFGPKLMS